MIQADAASSKNSSRAELPASSNLLKVKDDMDAMRALHAERELAWIESCRAKAEKAAAGGKNGGQQKIQTLELEKLQFEAGFRKAVQSQRDTLLRVKSQFLQISTDLQTVVALKGADLVAEVQTEAEKVSSAEKPVEEDVASQESDWESVLNDASQTAEALSKATSDLPHLLKNWHTSNPALKEYKEALSTFRAYAGTLKKKLEQAERLGRKKAAAAARPGTQPEATAFGAMTLKCLNEKTLRADDWGLEWSAATVLSAESSVKPVMFPEARTSSVLTALLDLAYYKEQRTYLQDSMAKSNTSFASGIVTKAAVRNKVEKLLRGLIPEAKQLQGMPPTVKDGLSAQFCQAKPDSHRWNFSTDFHMPLCIMCLEGELLCNGFKRPESSSAVNSELVLMSQSGADDWAEKLEWQCLLTPGKMLIVPCDHTYLTVCGSDTWHGVRWTIVSDAVLPKSIGFMRKVVSAEPDLKNSRVGVTLEYFESE